MDSLILIASCALMGGSVALVVYLLLMRGVSQIAVDVVDPNDFINTKPEPTKTVSVQESNSSNLHEVLLARSRSERVVKPWLEKMNSLVTGATPQSRIAVLHEIAVTGGLSRTWTPQRIATARTISLASGITFGLLFWRTLGGMRGLLLAAITIGIGWRGFDVYLTNRARARQEQIQRELPDIADQIAITVQAGLSFEQAIGRTVDSTEGPMAEELGRFLHDVRIGMSRTQAFKGLQERADVPDMTNFVRAIAQAEKTGVSIADVLQIQADELRVKRRQRAEERAMKLPVLMLLPLVTCILPPLLMVLLGPAVLQVIDSGFSG